MQRAGSTSSVPLTTAWKASAKMVSVSRMGELTFSFAGAKSMSPPALWNLTYIRSWAWVMPSS